MHNFLAWSANSGLYLLGRPIAFFTGAAFFAGLVAMAGPFNYWSRP
jgi:hypothetical protein